MIRKLLAVSVISATLTLGTAGIASAEPGLTPNPPSGTCWSVGGEGTLDCLLLRILIGLSSGSAAAFR